MISDHPVVYVASYGTFSCPRKMERQETFRLGRRCVCFVVVHYITVLSVMILRRKLKGEVSETGSMFRPNRSVQEGTKRLILLDCEGR